MSNITLNQLGVDSMSDDSYYFKGNKLNRVTIDTDADDDYRLVLFFIKKGTVMPLHDHPNMGVFFRLMDGELEYTSYDKLDPKFKYNDFAGDEYMEMIETKKRVSAKKTRKMKITPENKLLYVRPS